VIGHEDVGVQIAAMRAAGSRELFQVEPVIIGCIEAGLAVIATLGDVLGDTWQMQARWAGHGMSSVYAG